MMRLLLAAQLLVVGCSFPSPSECDRLVRAIDDGHRFAPRVSQLARRLQRAESAEDTTLALAVVAKLGAIGAKTERELEMAQALNDARLDGIFAEAACGTIQTLAVHETKRSKQNCSVWLAVLANCEGLIAGSFSDCSAESVGHREAR